MECYDSSSNSGLAVARVFRIPEIVWLICDGAKRSDLAKLLTTSRLFFNCVAPLVWKSLPEDAPRILMRLVPGGDLHMRDRLMDEDISASQRLDAGSLERFHLYTPYVNEVIQTNEFMSIRIWNKLCILVDKRPVLPNLKILKVSISTDLVTLDPHSSTVYPHLTPYMSSTLTDIDYVSEVYPFHESQHWPDFISSVAQKSPNLRSLKLGRVVPALGILNEPFCAGELASPFSQLHNLRVLALGPVPLDPKLLTALGSLPNLESLTLNRASNLKELGSEVPKRIIISLPPDSFPSLQHLGVEPCDDIEPVTRLWTIAPLVQRLTSISLRFCSNITVPQPQFIEFMRAICRGSPSIAALSLLSEGPSNYIELISPEVIKCLNRVSIQYLRLSSYIYARREGAIDQFALTFSNLKSLRIHEYFYFRELTFIAKNMPQLQQLSVKVIVDSSWPTKFEILALELPPSPSQMRLCLQIFHPNPGWRGVIESESGIPEERLEAIASGLLALWPNGVICESYELQEGGGNVGYVEEVNGALRRLSETEGPGGQIEVAPLKELREHVPPWLDGF